MYYQELFKASSLQKNAVNEVAKRLKVEAEKLQQALAKSEKFSRWFLLEEI